MSLLFFDDTRLYHRHNLKREYGVPELVKTTKLDGDEWSIQWPLGFWKSNEDGFYHMPVMAVNRDKWYWTVIMYQSADGESWEPENKALEAGIENPFFPNQCMMLKEDEEMGYIVYDEDDIPERRIKALTIVMDMAGEWADDRVYCSPDGFHWNEMRGACWNPRGAEPGAGVYKIAEKGMYGIAHRPTWGDRRICITTTKDFYHFSYPELKIMPDSIDPSEIECYGMRVTPYKGYYVGYLWIYHGLPTNENKYWGGKVDSQLAYSVNGTSWQRSIREAFIPTGPEGSFNAGMVYPALSYQKKDGTIAIFCAAFPGEHPTFRENGHIAEYTLREDGFMKLVAGEEEGYIATRPVILNGDEFDINIKCEGPATCAVYHMNGRTPLEGFSHEDSVPFTGDMTHWKPEWKSGKKLSELKSKVFCIQVKLASGELYAINGDMTPVTTHEAARYAKTGMTLNTTGF